MSPDHDDADLYPPDVEVVTADAASQRNRAIVGVSLVTLGTGLMLERVADNDLEYFWLAIGLGLLAGWAKVPRFPMFAVGAIMTGFAAGGLLESLDVLPFDGAIELLCATAGFLAVYVRYPSRARWALIPAAILGALSFAAFGAELIGLIPGAVTGSLLPLVLIGAGVLLVFRNRLPRSVVSCGVVVALLIFVSAAASSVGNWHDDPSGFQHPGVPTTFSDTGELIVRTTSGDVDIVIVPADEAPSIEVEGGGVYPIVEQEGPRPFAFTQPFLARPDDDRRVSVPAGFPLIVMTTSGSVEGEYAGGSIAITTATGDVRLALVKHERGAWDSDKLDITTTSASVDIDAEDWASASITAETGSGEIDVNDEELTSPFMRESSGPLVTIQTVSGDIEIDELAAAA